MKRKFIVLIIALMILSTALLFYRVQTDKKIQIYLNYFSDWSKRNGNKIGLDGDIKLKRVIKKSPIELIMILRCGEKDVYVSVENWLTKHHDMIEIRPFSKDHAVIYE